MADEEIYDQVILLPEYFEYIQIIEQEYLHSLEILRSEISNLKLSYSYLKKPSILDH